MSGIGLRRRRAWRRLVSCLAAYAFALQLVLLGFAAAPAAGLADQAALNAALCLHDKSTPLAPAHNSGGQEHCKFCPVGGHPVFTAPSAAHHAIVRTAEAAAPPAAAAFAPRPRAYACAQPRGPPPA
ncbi:MAG TPA: hypothetical protein VGX95_16140 [Xanthobacteraceae bacterium]|nr:hypothetical protein [Xanthobacteraceae bacterium]